MQPKQQDEDRILLAHVQDLARRNAYRSFTAFLDMRQYTLVRRQLRAGTYRFFGGYPEAQRGILCLHPEGCPPEDAEFPITCLTITFPARSVIRSGAAETECPLSHRDVLGSLMAQQVRRDTVGDILITAERIQCFVTGAAAAVGMELTKIGRIGVKVTDALPYAGDFVQRVQRMEGTVSSPRLDAVLRTALSLGRQACCRLILAGEVTVGHVPCLKPERLLSAGEVFSVRGYGKFRIAEIGSPTRKDRLHIHIEKFL